MDVINQDIVQDTLVPTAYAPPPPLPIMHLGVEWVKGQFQFVLQGQKINIM